MNDDAFSLRTVWMSDPSGASHDVAPTLDAVLARHRAMQERERRVRVVGVLGLALVVPLLVWAGAHGVTPLIRAAYTMMAVGCGLLLAAESLYLEWSRQALPGPSDARSQLQMTAFMLARQVRLMNTALLWSSPIFIGVALIAIWMYRERTPAGAVALGIVIVAAWVAAGFSARSTAGRIDNGRREMERVLNDLR